MIMQESMLGYTKYIQHKSVKSINLPFSETSITSYLESNKLFVH